MATFGLIPGAGGDAGYWYRVEPLLRAAGHDVVAVPLPNSDGVGLAEHADAVVAAVGDRSDVVLVAQSMGGFAAPLACDRLPVILLVLVNAMIGLPGETPGAWWDATGQGEAKRAKDIREGRDPDADFDPLVQFFNDVPQPVIDEVMTHEVPAPASSIFSSTLAIEAWPAVPTRVLVAREDRLLPAEFQRRVAAERLGISADEIPGGHLVALGRPDELVAALLGLLAELPR